MGDEIFERGNPVCRRPAFLIDVDFDGHGHAMQWADCFALFSDGIKRFGTFQSLLRQVHYDGVQCPIDTMHPINR